MARPSSGDIWHLSIDDLLAPLTEAPRLGGPGPFVINLSASTAPISQAIKGVVGCPDAHVYQIQRTEDRRLRYRLRLGPFETEDEAIAVIEKVRDIYPGALIATAEADDLRALETMKTKISVQTKPIARPKADAPAVADGPVVANAPVVAKAPAVANAPVVAEAPTVANGPTLADGSAAPDRARPPLKSIPVLLEAVSVVRPAAARPTPPRRPPQASRNANNRAMMPAAAPQIKPWVAKAPEAKAPESKAPEARPPEAKTPEARPPLIRDLPLQIPPAAIDPPVAAASDGIPWLAEPPLPADLPLHIPPAAIEPEKAAAPDAIPWVPEPPPQPKAPHPKAPELKPSSVQPPSVKAPPSRPSVVRPLPVKPAPGPAAAKPVAQIESGLPSFESTQTIRPLTPLELQDDGASRWFVIQLAIAEQAFDPDSLPNLDIFSVYRLYSVAGLEQGRVMHALRLGFFSDEIAAGAVASYLTTFYQSSAVKRVSTAERQRFADHRFEARKDVGATGQHAAIEITGERVVRETRVAGATSPAPKSADPPSAPAKAAQKSRWF